MLGDILNKQYEYRLFLCKPDKTVLNELLYTDISFIQSFRTYNELSVSIPYYEQGCDLIKDTRFDLAQSLYLIYLQIYNGDTKIYDEYFCIDSETLGMDNGKPTKSLHCYSAHYMTFNKRILRSYEYVKVLYDSTQPTVASAGLLNTLLVNLNNTWTVSEIHSDFVGVYRSWNYASSTYTEVLEDVCTQLGCYIFFNNVNNTIQIKKPATVGVSSGLILSDSNYIKRISGQPKLNEMTTRLRIYGKDNCSIARYNPTGQLYIDNFSYLQENGYFSTSLSDALDAYNALLASVSGTFTGYVDSLDTLEANKVVKEIELRDLNSQLTVLEDSMDIEKTHNNSTTATYTTLYGLYTSKLGEISSKESEISSLQSQIDAVNANIISLNTSLSYSSNFTTAQLNELTPYIYEQDLTLNSISNTKQLYDYACAYIIKKSIPTIDLELDCIDLFSAQDAQLDWDKVVLGNFVYLDCPELGYDYYQTRIVKITHNKLANSLSMTLSNADKINSDLLYLNDIFKVANTASNTLVVKQFDYEAYKSDIDNILYSNGIIDADTTNIKIGNSLINRRGFIGSDIGSSGALQLKDGKLILTRDNWSTFNTILSGNGLYLEAEDKMSRIVLTPSPEEVGDITINFGIQIDVNIGTVESPEWSNVFYTSDGNLYLTGNILVGSGSIKTLINKYGIDTSKFKFFKNMCYNSSFERFDMTTKQPAYWSAGISTNTSSFYETYSMQLNAGVVSQQTNEAIIKSLYYENISDKTRISFHKKGGSVKISVINAMSGSEFILTNENGDTGTFIEYTYNENWIPEACTVSFEHLIDSTPQDYYIKFENSDGSSRPCFIDAVCAEPDYTGMWSSLYSDGQFSDADPYGQPLGSGLTVIDNEGNPYSVDIYVQPDEPATPVLNDLWVDTDEIDPFDPTSGHDHDGTDSKKITYTNLDSIPSTFAPSDHASDHVTGGGDVIADAVAAGNSGLMSGADKSRLDGIDDGANNYTHPANHNPSIITQDTNNRFVTDAEKSAWNAAEANQNAFSHVAVSGQTTVDADAETDTLTLAAGSNVTLTTSGKTVTITASGSGGGSGDMLKEEYDTDEDGIIDHAYYSDTAGSAGRADSAASLNHVYAPYIPAVEDNGKYLKYDSNLDRYVLDTPTGGGGTPTTRWEPLTDGDLTDPQLIFYQGDILMVEVAL